MEIDKYRIDPTKEMPPYECVCCGNIYEDMELVEGGIPCCFQCYDLLLFNKWKWSIEYPDLEYPDWF